MILLIDEKTERQKECNWDDDRFLKYEREIDLVRITDEKELNDARRKILDDKNLECDIILLHQSFYDNTNVSKDLNEIIDKVKSDNTLLVQFSGTNQNRTITGNIVTLSVQAFYSNLESALRNYNKVEKDILPKYFAFGENFKMEELLIAKKKLWAKFFRLKTNETINKELYNIKYKTNLEIIEQLIGSPGLYSENISVSELKHKINSKINTL